MAVAPSSRRKFPGYAFWYGSVCLGPHDVNGSER